MYEWMYLLIGLIIGSASAFLITRFYMQTKRVLTIDQKNTLDQDLKNMEVENRVQVDKYEALFAEYLEIKKGLEEERNKTLESAGKT
jgi:uncharacterized membrane-anchored protein YhcB (DUF1043 family)